MLDLVQKPRQKQQKYKKDRGRFTSSLNSYEGDWRETGGRLEGDWRETRGRLEGDSRETRGRLEGDSRETRGRLEGDSRATRGRLEGDCSPAVWCRIQNFLINFFLC